MHQPYRPTSLAAVVAVVVLAVTTLVGIAAAWWSWQQHLPG